MKIRQPSEYLNFMEAFLLLHLSKFVILFFPFKKIAAHLGKLQIETPQEKIMSIKIQQVEQAINRASRFTIHDSKCYDQALTGKYMLNRRKLSATLYFGLAKENGSGLSAHAWVRCGTRILTGRAGMENYTVIACFGD
jgi:hypothetical protein